MINTSFGSFQVFTVGGLRVCVPRHLLHHMLDTPQTYNCISFHTVLYCTYPFAQCKEILTPLPSPDGTLKCVYKMLPRPSLSFTIPSLHDQTKLDCRVYHPEILQVTTQQRHTPPWGRHVAIVAHPYAPLGGCYDDPIVDLVGGTLLQLGFLVATFNFRLVPLPTST